MKEKIVVFGTGKYYQNRKKRLDDYDVVAFLDNSIDKQGNYLDGKLIYKPDDVLKIEYDYIFLMSLSQEEMRNQLIAIGVSSDLIWDLDEFIYFKNKNKAEIYGSNLSFFEKGKHILFISNDINYTGAPIACVYACQALQNRGYKVAILSHVGDERLIGEIIEKGITVIKYNNIRISRPGDLWFLRLFDIIVINTYAMLAVVDSVAFYTKPIVWIHEAKEFYRIADRLQDITRLKKANVKVVSKIAQRHFNQYFPEINTEILTYGISENEYILSKKTSKKNNKLVIGIVGGINKRKGQLEFIRAIGGLPNKYLCQLNIMVIGVLSNDSYSHEFRTYISNVDFVEFLGRKSRKEMTKVYSKLDVVAVPSEDDPLPITATEGMMYGKICMVSERTGTADYIKDKENGLIIKYGDENDIRRKVIWLLDNQDKIYEIGKKSRDLYERHFSLDSFADQFEEYLRIKD